MLQSEIAWCWAGREVSAGKAKAVVMESLSRAVGSRLPFAASPKAAGRGPVSHSWACLVTARQAFGVGVIITGASLGSLPGAHWTGGECTTFPTKGGQRALQQAPGPQNLCYPGCQPALGTLEHG